MTSSEYARDVVEDAAPRCNGRLRLAASASRPRVFFMIAFVPGQSFVVGPVAVLPLPIFAPDVLAATPAPAPAAPSTPRPSVTAHAHVVFAAPPAHGTTGESTAASGVVPEGHTRYAARIDGVPWPVEHGVAVFAISGVSPCAVRVGNGLLYVEWRCALGIVVSASTRGRGIRHDGKGYGRRRVVAQGVTEKRA